MCVHCPEHAKPSLRPPPCCTRNLFLRYLTALLGLGENYTELPSWESSSVLFPPTELRTSIPVAHPRLAIASLGNVFEGSGQLTS